jgi:signal transduction histidine kinase
MTAYVDLLKQEGLDSPNAPEYLDIIDNKTQRLKALTENLFDAAKASSGAIPVTISAIDLAALVNQALAEMEGKLSQRSLTVILKNKCEDSSRVMADGQLLWRVIENLLSNVSKYALTGSRVYVNISRLQASDTAAGGSAADGAGAVGFGFAGATVGGFGGGSTDGAGGAAGAGANLGAGGAGSFGAGSACFSEIDGAAATKILLEVKNISAEQLNISAEELMERFKRGDESRNTEGSGLGLAIARDLTNLMKGTFHLTIDGDLFKASVALHEAGGQEGGQGSSGMEVASE